MVVQSQPTSKFEYVRRYRIIKKNDYNVFKNNGCKDIDTKLTIHKNI